MIAFSFVSEVKRQKIMASSTPATKAMFSDPRKHISGEKLSASAAAAALPPSALASAAPTNSHSPSSAVVQPPPCSASTPTAADCNPHPSDMSIAEQSIALLASVPHRTNSKRKVITANAKDKLHQYFSVKGWERDKGLPPEFQGELGKIVKDHILSKAQIMG